MRGSNDIDLMVIASLMPTPDGLLLLAALDGSAPPSGGREQDGAPDATGLALLLGGATLVLGVLAMLPAGMA
ncbi:hypothetical protein J2847_002129 [Azospirillum agricola]|uniref:hypothetical protein n=1 Tax=Azospirillum agricola TaxID=1720247 RepID=UPI001AE5BAE6|nr:hypothetical protein [Azospirillum agricola]MBP2228837.1 hypothetical protein [Azospirillum agricola]